MNHEEIIKLIWEEYHHGYEGMKGASSAPKGYKSYLQFSGHAQCALNLLSRLGVDVGRCRQDMAEVMAGILGIKIDDDVNLERYV